ncbi:MAG: acylneuraminate cytidylyltransferase family protein [Planctomycetota bacterium]
MRADAIILARGGSKGVPRKNVRDVAGRPCIAWTIEHAQRSDRVDRVLVSTDDSEVLAIAKSMCAETHHRSDELAHDTARVDDAAREAARCSGLGEALVILYGNVPVRPADLTDRAVDLLDRSVCDSVQSYCASGKHHPWWTATLSGDGSVAPWEGDVLNHGVFRRQDLPPAFVPDGGVIALSRAALNLELEGIEPGPHAFFGRDRRGIETRDGEVIDIDTELDLIVASTVLSGVRAC